MLQALPSVLVELPAALLEQVKQVPVRRVPLRRHRALRVDLPTLRGILERNRGR